MTATIGQRSGPAATALLSVGSYRPSRVVTNAEICTRIDSSDEWIRERSGIVERRYAAPDESVTDMGVAAGRIALERSGVQASQISMVLVATVTHPLQTPSAAAEISYRLGASNAAATDISSACAGFCYGLGLADSMIRAGNAEYVLVIGVEKLSDWVNEYDRSTAFIFADGAGAVVVGASTEVGIGPTVWGADGSQTGAITMTQTLIEYRNEGGPVFPHLVMQGQQVFRWAVGEMPKVAFRALEAAGLTVDDLDAFIPHQANMRITDALVRAMKLPEGLPVARDIATTGNTSAASIPLAMDRMLAEGDLRSGDIALIIGFGAGLVFAAQVIRVP
jgi:3-oxoacyl-[acyl-carrier-protein] synthase-3